MTFDQSWDSIHREREWLTYPKEALVLFVRRHYYGASDRGAVRFLDLGCGNGASTEFLVREGFNVDAIDGSEVAFERLRRRLASRYAAAGAAGCYTVGCLDVTSPEFLKWLPAADYDCILDVACLQHVESEDHDKVVEAAYKALKPGGRFFAVMLCDASSGDILHTNTRCVPRPEDMTFFRPFSEVRLGLITTLFPIPLGSKEPIAWIKEWIVEARK